MHSSKYLAFLLLLAAAVVLAACSGGGSSQEVSCVALSSFRSYRFEAVGISEVKESPEPSPIVAAPFPPFRLVVEVEGETQGADTIDALVRQGDGEGFQERRTIVIGQKIWTLLGDRWLENERTTSQLPIPYVPVDTCRAIAPDLKLADLPSTAEDVNGVASLHYQLELPNMFFARHPNFGPSGDTARLIESVAVDVWIAEGANYPVKVGVVGTGSYPGGSELRAEVGYEISDISSSDIEISPPVEPGGN